MLPPRLGAPSARPGPAAAAGGGGGGRGGRPSHERRGSGLLGLAPKVPTGEEVEALRMEEEMVCASERPFNRRSRCIGILQK